MTNYLSVKWKNVFFTNTIFGNYSVILLEMNPPTRWSENSFNAFSKLEKASKFINFVGLNIFLNYSFLATMAAKTTLTYDHLLS